MNLVEDQWIPVTKLDGKKTEASLHDIFTSGPAYADLAVRPHERVAIMRLLLCIAQAALDGPETFEQWETAPELLPEKADKYLIKWEDYFDVFHAKKPFLQIADLDSSAPSPVCKMDIAMASGNSTTLFDHRGNDEESRNLSEGSIAVNLLTFQNFSSGGGASIVNWRGVKTKQVGNPDAPCLKGAMYHAFLKGDDLAQTVHLNLLTKSGVGLGFGGKGWGKPVWEMMPSNPNDSAAISNATETYLGRLVPLSRWVKLQDLSWMRWGNGFFYPVFPDFGCPEPSATSIERKDNQGNLVRDLLKASHDRGIWRKLAALVVKRKADSVGGALALGNVPENGNFDIHVCALLRKRATMEAYQESVFNIPSGMNTDIGRAAYDAEVMVAEAKALRLGWAVEKWRKEVDPDWDQRVKVAKNKSELSDLLCGSATNHFWTAVEKNLPLLLAYTSSIGRSENATKRKNWRRSVHQTARDAYYLVCGRTTPRQIRAFAMGLRVLEGEDLKEREKKEE